MLPLCTLLLLVSCLFGLLEAKSSTGESVLVIVDPTRKDDYSIFFNGLKEDGYELTFRGPREEKPLLIEDDVPQFSHVVLLGSNDKNFAKDITPQSIVELTTKGTNVLLALSQKQTFLNSLAAEFSLILPPPGTPLISYFPERDEPPTIIPLTAPSKSKSHIELTSGSAPIWFSGTPFSLGSNPLLFPILNAPAESFAADTDSGSDALADAVEKGGEGLWAGSQLAVVAGFQVAGGSRATWVGGSELFSDAFTKKTLNGAKSGNAEFSRDLAAWTFQETGVFRIDSTTHHLVNDTEEKEYYTNNDNVVFEAAISHYNPKTATWEPYSGFTDIQLEFTMLDPHIRTSLPPVPGQAGKYEVTFRAPDRHGVFKLVVNYKRKGLTYLFSSTTVPVVPPRHDGYPRFLSAAWPYYTGAISTSIAFFLFSALWLAGEVKPEKATKGKTE